LVGAIFFEGIAIEVEIAHSVDGELRKGTGFVELLVELDICYSLNFRKGRVVACATVETCRTFQTSPLLLDHHKKNCSSWEKKFQQEMKEK